MEQQHWSATLVLVVQAADDSHVERTVTLSSWTSRPGERDADFSWRMIVEANEFKKQWGPCEAFVVYGTPCEAPHSKSFYCKLIVARHNQIFVFTDQLNGGFSTSTPLHVMTDGNDPSELGLASTVRLDDAFMRFERR